MEQSAQTISNRNEFNPLLRNEPKTQEAITACAKLLLSGKLDSTPYAWRELSEWIGGYEYILPNERKINDKLAILLIQNYGTDKFLRLTHSILANFSAKTQEDLIKWISDCNNSHTQVS